VPVISDKRQPDQPQRRRRAARSLGCFHNRGKALELRAGRLVVEAFTCEPVSTLKIPCYTNGLPF